MLDTRLGQEILREGMQKGIQKGMQKGMQKGIQKGIPQGAQHVVLRQIATRFGGTPDGIRRKILRIKDTKKLDRIAVKLLKARSLAELERTL